ncbi:MAG: helix-turn-helix domain-containing protein [Candidatus Hydrogenedentes bacterium]|nr:helix-turn-helix domain-containing protein [Candidatus Hydrogenedentota bacterium]MDK1020799.1 helix-turn-helix domain-containing protein [Candidatus Hydrogenedentota bacterium]
MPDIARVLKEEIQRLARKESKMAVANLRKDNAMLKRVAADHKRRLAKLERQNRLLLSEAQKRRKQSMLVADGDVDKARITAKMVHATRDKLRLSQADFAKLVGVSTQTVYQWEHKEGRLSFRGNAKTAIVAVRKFNRKEAQQQLEALREKKKAKRKRKPSR